MSIDQLKAATVPTLANNDNNDGVCNDGSDGLTRPAGRKAAKNTRRKKNLMYLDSFMEEFFSMRKEALNRFKEEVFRRNLIE